MQSLCKVYPFSVAFFQAPQLLTPYESNLKKSLEALVKRYPDLRYLLPDQ